MFISGYQRWTGVCGVLFYCSEVFAATQRSDSEEVNGKYLVDLCTHTG